MSLAYFAIVCLICGDNQAKSACGWSGLPKDWQIWAKNCINYQNVGQWHFVIKECVVSYQTLSLPCTATYEIKKSEFLAFAYPIQTREQLLAWVQHLRQQYPDARHHCYGYIIGDPHNTTSAGFDDDGEPNGTAGRPILSVLQHKAIGNCLIVVVRYFGGIKLGAGGLTRAYATAAQMVVDQMVLSQFVPQTTLRIKTSFAHEAQLRYLVLAAGGEMLQVDYALDVCATVRLDAARLKEFVASLGVYGQLLDSQ